MNFILRILTFIIWGTIVANLLHLPQDMLSVVFQDQMVANYLVQVWAMCCTLTWMLYIIAVCIQHLGKGFGLAFTTTILMGICGLYITVSHLFVYPNVPVESEFLKNTLCLTLSATFLSITGGTLLSWGKGQCPQFMGFTLVGYSIYQCISELGSMFSKHWVGDGLLYYAGKACGTISDAASTISIIFLFLFGIAVLIGKDRKLTTN